MATLKTKIEEKQPELTNHRDVVFQQDNAQPHITVNDNQLLIEYGWDVLRHPPYSLDLFPSDFHLSR